MVNTEKYQKLKKWEIRSLEHFGGNINSHEHHVKFYEEKNKEIDFQNERFDKYGIPPNSIKLEVGKNYEGNADDEWEILTINNELWFCSNWSCLNFDEKQYD